MKSHQQSINNRQGTAFTLVELLVAMGIFAIVGTIALSLFVSLTQSRRRIELANVLVTEGRILMERLTREVRRNMVDYGEYYNRRVLAGMTYGTNFTSYAEQFFNPGSDGALGARCNDGATPMTSTPASAGCPAGSVINTTTIDLDTGQNPAAAPGVDPATATALCDNDVPGSTCTGTTGVFPERQLYLIDPTGRRKTIIGLEELGPPSGFSTSEFSLSIVQLNGSDADGNGVLDTWMCAQEFICNSVLGTELATAGTPLPSSGTRIGSEIILQNAKPITPLALSVDDVEFLIMPVEDPARAWNEENMEVYPAVMIRIALRPSAAVSRGATIPPLVLQTTVIPEIHRRIPMGESTS